jgi:hypothetical protein
MELVQSSLKGYASIWSRMMRKRKGKPMTTHGNSSRNTLNWNSFQRILTTSQGVNSMTF